MRTEIFEPVTTVLTDIADEEERNDALQSGTRIHLKNILVPVDLTEMSVTALRYAVALARQFHAKITLLHIIAPFPIGRAPNETEIAEARVQDIRQAHIPSDVPVETVIRHDYVFDGIPRVASAVRADLIVIPTHGYTGLKHLLTGSTAEHVARTAPCPVLIAQEFQHDFL